MQQINTLEVSINVNFYDLHLFYNSISPCTFSWVSVTGEARSRTAFRVDK